MNFLTGQEFEGQAIRDKRKLLRQKEILADEKRECDRLKEELAQMTDELIKMNEIKNKLAVSSPSISF